MPERPARRPTAARQLLDVERPAQPRPDREPVHAERDARRRRPRRPVARTSASGSGPERGRRGSPCPRASRRPAGSSAFTTARRACSGGEQPRLRLEVRLHRAVVVQVVLGQVREDRDVEHDARRRGAGPARATRPPSRPRRRRRRASARAAGAGPAPRASSARAGPAARRSRAPVVPITPGRHPAGPEDRLEQVGGVVLPFVPVTPTVVIDVGRVAEQRPPTSAPSPRGPTERAPAATSSVEPPLDDERRGAGVDRLRREVVSVDVRARDAEEQRAGRDLPGVERASVTRDRGVAADVGCRRRRRPVGERHEGEGGCHRLRAYPRPRSRAVGVMAARARGAEARRGAPAGCPAAGSRNGRPAGTAARRRRRRRSWRARR